MNKICGLRRNFSLPSKIIKGTTSRKEILIGANKLSRAVQATLGPGGRNVAIDPWSPGEQSALSVDPKPIITKDGVTVAQNVKLF